MRTKIKYKNTCYVLLQIDQIHPIAHLRHKLIWYPERAMTLLDCVQYKPFVKSVVTENPWIISCYDRDNVRLWEKEYGWITPNDQTYGASVNHITHHLLKIRQTIPSTPLDGGEEIQKLIQTLKGERPNENHVRSKVMK
jgi:hypothetical protein